MEQAMTQVRFPYMRREAIHSIAALADRAYQERVWVRHDLPDPKYYDSLDAEIDWLIDDLRLLPDPGPADGDVLLPGDESARLRRLGVIFDPMIDRLGNRSDSEYISDPEWIQVVDLAQRCLSALILAGGWECTQTDAQAFAEDRREGIIATVDLPATRRRVIRAVAALADSEYQQRTWTGGNADIVIGSLDACLHTLTNDSGVLPNPDTAIVKVLVAGDEIDRLAILGSALGRIKDTSDARESPHWPAVVDAALNCLPALVLAGAWIGPDQIPSAAAGRHGR